MRKLFLLMFVIQSCHANDLTWSNISRNQQIQTISSNQKSTLTGLLLIEGIFSDTNQGAGRFNRQSGFSTICIPRVNINYTNMVNKWLTAHMTLAFRGSCGYGTQNDEGRFKQYPRPLDEAFVVIANKKRSPLYAIFGVASAPFGDYQRNMIPATFTQLISQIQSTIITTGVNFDNGFSASGYIFKNPKQLLSRNVPTNGGITTAYRYQLNHHDFIKISADWIYDIASSSNYIVYNKANFNKKSDGIHLGLKSQIKSYDMLIQYVFTTNRFDVKNTPLIWAKPSALLLQAGFSHTLANEPARIGIAIHRSWESLNLGPGGLPKYRAHVLYQYEPWKNFIFGLHGILDIDYNRSEGGTGRKSLTGIFTFRTILG